MTLRFIDAGAARLDLVGLGEVMIRLSPPGHGRIEQATTFEVHVGGAEYNVAAGAARLGLRAGWAGALVDNALGALVRRHALAAGLDLAHVRWVPFDGVGREARVGLNFTEVGTGVRPSVALYDRGHSAASQLGPGDLDLHALFSGGVRWFHVSGVFTALGPGPAALAAEAMAAARAAGAVVSYDLNFRGKLWSSEAAIRATRPLMPLVDVLIGNEEEFQRCLGYDVAGVDGGLRRLPREGYGEMARRVAADLPGLKVVATTLRRVRSGLLNDWEAVAFDVEAGRLVASPRFEALEIEDRVGGGDGFVAGLAWGLLGGEPLEAAVALGAACGALAQSTRGDHFQGSAAEVRHVAAGGSARIVR